MQRGLSACMFPPRIEPVYQIEGCALGIHTNQTDRQTDSEGIMIIFFTAGLLGTWVVGNGGWGPVGLVISFLVSLWSVSLRLAL